MENLENLHIENDKIHAPFLLAASFNGLIQFNGSHVQDSVLYWQFSPKDRVLQLIAQFRTKTEPHIAAKDLFEATETWWKQVAEMKNGEIKNGPYQTR